MLNIEVLSFNDEVLRVSGELQNLIVEVRQHQRR